MNSNEATAHVDVVEVKPTSDKMIISGIAGVVFVLFLIVSLGSVLLYRTLSVKQEGSQASLFEEIVDGFLIDDYQIDKPVYPDANNDLKYQNDSTVTTESTSSVEVKNPPPANVVKPPVPGCIRYQIDLEGFESNKCYTNEDYSALLGLLAKYEHAQFSISTAEKRIEIVCNGSEFFEDNCEDAQKDLSVFKNVQDETKNLILVTISKGRQ